MNMKSGFGLTGFVLLGAAIVIGAIFLSMRQEPDLPIDSQTVGPSEMFTSTTTSQVSEVVPEGFDIGDAPAPVSDEPKKETFFSVPISGSILAGKSSPILDFKQSDYEQAVKTNKLIVLYFYADWCPVCRRETRESLYPAFNELSGDDVIGFRVNYNDPDTDDAEQALAKRYRVLYQHTKVFIKNGKEVLRSPEMWDKVRYLMEINSHK